VGSTRYALLGYNGGGRKRALARDGEGIVTRDSALQYQGRKVVRPNSGGVRGVGLTRGSG